VCGPTTLLDALTRATRSGFVPGLADLPPGLNRLLRLLAGYVGALAEVDPMNRAFLLLWAEAATSAERDAGARPGGRRLRVAVVDQWRRAPAAG
jgi:hypothetical protein